MISFWPLWWAALLEAIPALLKVYFHTNELVTSLMFNYVFSCLWDPQRSPNLLADRAAGTFASLKYQPTALPGSPISGTKFHSGYLIAIAVVIPCYIPSGI